MEVFRAGKLMTPIIDIDAGEVFDYEGSVYIRTTMRGHNFGNVDVECCNLLDGTVKWFPDQTRVNILNAKVVIE